MYMYMYLCTVHVHVGVRLQCTVPLTRKFTPMHVLPVSKTQVSIFCMCGGELVREWYCTCTFLYANRGSTYVNVQCTCTNDSFAVIPIRYNYYTGLICIIMCACRVYSSTMMFHVSIVYITIPYMYCMDSRVHVCLAYYCEKFVQVNSTVCVVCPQCLCEGE